MTITRKIKIGKLVFIYIEPISNLPRKFKEFKKVRTNLLHFSVATLFRNWLASLAVEVKTLVSTGLKVCMSNLGIQPNNE